MAAVDKMQVEAMRPAQNGSHSPASSRGGSATSSGKKSVRNSVVMTDDAITIRVHLPGIEEHSMISCRRNVTCGTFVASTLRALAPELLIRYGVSAATPDGTNVPLDDVLWLHPYIAECEANSKVPILYLNGATPTDTRPPPRKPRRRTTSMSGRAKRPLPPSPIGMFLANVPSGDAAGDLLSAKHWQVREPSTPNSRTSTNGITGGSTLNLFDEDVSGVVNIAVLLPNGFRVDLAVSAEDTVAVIKGAILQCNGVPDDVVANRSSYVLHGEGPLGSIQSESMVLGTLPYVKTRTAAGLPVRFYLVEKDEKRTEKLKSKQIGALIGRPIIREADDGLDEAALFRQNIRRMRMQMAQEGIVSVRAIEPYVLAEMERPPNMPTHILCKFNIFSGEINKTLKIDLNLTPTETVAEVFRNAKNVLANPPDPSVCVIQVTGMADYFIGEYAIWRYEYVHKCAMEGTSAEVNILRSDSVAELTEAAVEEIETELVFDDDDAGAGGANDKTHESMSISNFDFPTQMAYQSLRDISSHLNLTVVGLADVDFAVPPDGDDDGHGKKKKKDKDLGVCEAFFVEASLYHGQRRLGEAVFTSIYPCGMSTSPTLYDKITITFPMSGIPREARVCFTVWGQKKYTDSVDIDPENANTVALGWANVQLIDYRALVASGRRILRLWPHDSANPLGMCTDNPSRSAASLCVFFDEYLLPIAFPVLEATPPPADQLGVLPEHDSPANRERLEYLIGTDPLFEMDNLDTSIMWLYRFWLINRPEALPKVLLSVNFGDPAMVAEMHGLLSVWTPLEPVDALELLDANFIDAAVRSFAVRCLAQMSDEKLCDYLLQLVQALKYEPYHDNELCRFLIRRALTNRKLGHSFFWFMKAEVDDPASTERYSLLLEAYLRGCGAHKKHLALQNDVFKMLTTVANNIKLVSGSEERLASLLSQLEQLKLPETFQILLNPRLQSNGLIVSKCKYMDSKKLPLWLVFENSDKLGKPIYIIFKSGDDLRQDMLTLQMFSIMDRLWEMAGLDLRLQPYGCVATGPDLGMIEVVMNANTVANIQMEYGGTTAAFKEEPLAAWLGAIHNTESSYARAVDTFTLSSAAYCVATYVLGIGDRHNDNIMLQESGRLFHIDFGHFLGNIKRKFGVKRERTPFVLTPDMVYVMGGRDSAGFQRFVDLCIEAHAVLRTKANLFINLFGMMISTGIPELRSTKDLFYLKEALCVGKSDAEAAEFFRERIYESIDNGWSTQVNWWIHNLAHRH